MKLTAEMSSIPLTTTGATAGPPTADSPTASSQTANSQTGPVQKGIALATPPNEVPDANLVLRLRMGEAAAGETLVRRYYQPLLRYLQRLLGSEQLAEEMHQQTWLSVLEHIDRFDAANCAGGFKAWLFRIATNKANDHWRSAAREKSARDGLKLIADEELPAASHRMECTEQEARLKKAIEKLPDAQRQVLLLRYYSGLKFVEIAQALGCPLNTALGRMHKAMLKLKDLMSDDPWPKKPETGN